MADRAVVGAGELENLDREIDPLGQGDRTTGHHLLRHPAVVIRISDHDHALVILGRGAEHGRTAHVDVLDGHFPGTGETSDGYFERVQIHHDHVHHLDPEIGEHATMLWRSLRQHAGQNAGVERLDASLETFGEVRDLIHVHDWHVMFAQEFRRPTGRDDFPAQSVKTPRELIDPVLVRDTDDDAGHD